MVFPAKKFIVQIESVTSSFPAYELSIVGWNGWACPGFTLEIAQQVIGEFCAMCKASYDPTLKVFTIVYPDGMIEEYAAQTHVTDDGVKELYPLGAWAWTWEVVE